MSKLDKIVSLTILYDLYKNMLTDKQVQIFKLYYLEDLSLAEISEQEGISKPAVSDTLKKTEEKLISLEEKLNLGVKLEMISKIAEDLEDTGKKELALKIKNLF